MGETGHAGVPVTENMVIAALLHDTVEDRQLHVDGLLFSMHWACEMVHRKVRASLDEFMTIQVGSALALLDDFHRHVAQLLIDSAAAAQRPPIEQKQKARQCHHHRFGHQRKSVKEKRQRVEKCKT